MASVKSAAGPGNPLDPSADYEERIRRRAYHLWEDDGRPHGRDAEFWERARELEAIRSNPTAGELPIATQDRPDEAALEDNLGEFPDRLADQGEHRVAPMTRPQARAAGKGR